MSQCKPEPDTMERQCINEWRQKLIAIQWITDATQFNARQRIQLGDAIAAFADCIHEVERLSQSSIPNRDNGGNVADNCTHPVEQCGPECIPEPDRRNAEVLKQMHAEAWTREQVFNYAYGLGELSAAKKLDGMIKAVESQSESAEDNDKFIALKTYRSGLNSTHFEPPDHTSSSEYRKLFDAYEELKNYSGETDARLEEANTDVSELRQKVSLFANENNELNNAIGAWKREEEINIEGSIHYQERIKELEREVERLTKQKEALIYIAEQVEKERDRYRAALEKLCETPSKRKTNLRNTGSWSFAIDGDTWQNALEALGE